MAARTCLAKFVNVHQHELRDGQFGQHGDRVTARVEITGLEGQEEGAVVIGERSPKRTGQALEGRLVIVIGECFCPSSEHLAHFAAQISGERASFWG
jgi:hypothetical protein